WSGRSANCAGCSTSGRRSDLTCDNAIMTEAQRSRPRRGRPGYDLESLLSVAVKLFNERGYDGTSMEDLSRKLGITKSAIYHHVRSKDDLLQLAVNRALDGLFAEADRLDNVDGPRSEERRGGKECGGRWAAERGIGA